MIYRWNFPLSVFVLASSVSLVGCVPGMMGSSSSSSDQSGATGGGERGISSSEVPPSAQARSLEAFQRGSEIPSTSSSSKSSSLQDIYFEFNRFTLRPEARETLNANARWLQNNPRGRIEIEGHADEKGGNEYNLALGARRAQAVKDYLVTLGIGSNRLSTISYGEELPVCKTKSETCWQKNRRIHFVIIGFGPAS